MPSPTFESLRQTLGKLRRRRRRLFILRQSSYFAVAASALLLAGSALAAWLEPGRAGSIALFAALVAAILALGWRLASVLRRLRTDDRRLAHYVEDHIPGLEQRLLTSLEFDEQDLTHGRRGVSQRFIQQLWEDAQAHVRQQQEDVESVASSRAPLIAFACAAAAIAVAAALFITYDPLRDAGNRIAWPFDIVDPVQIAPPLLPVEIAVEPGDTELQRGDSITIVARVTNAIPGAVTLRLQDDNVNWRNAAMTQDTADNNSATYSYFLPVLQNDTAYYVSFNERGEHSSPQYRISLYDLPRVEQIDLAFDYPDYIGVEDAIDEDSGDMVVPEGTRVDLTVAFNKAIAEATVEFETFPDEDEDENRNENSEGPARAPYENLPLTIDGKTGRASFTVTRNGLYRIMATDHAGLRSGDPLEYYVSAIADSPPELTLRRPGRDVDVMPLEEVVLEVEASDDYGLTEFTLNYSTLTEGEVAVDFLAEPGATQATGSELIYLEDLGVRPGDFVSYYLTIADNNGLLDEPVEIVSDIYFLQVIATDREYRRGERQSGGGQGSQGGDSSALVSIQKDIIAGTWKLKNRLDEVSAEDLAADAEILAESQREATSRATMSINRLRERVDFSDDTYNAAVENLSLAVEQMELASAELDLQQVTAALKPEQLALQYILRAQASINRTEVTMGQSGGGSGSDQQESEDLRELFEMEMGEHENRYESPNTPSSADARDNEEIDRLAELARRQEGLTRAQRNLARRQEQMTEEQHRRELERLRRQQEQLSREVERLARQISQRQQGDRERQGQQQQQSQSGGAQTASSSSGGQSQSDNPLERAVQQMQDAASSDSAAVAAARSQKALESLRQQHRELSQQPGRSVEQIAQNLAQRGQQLLQQQQQLREALAETSHEQGLGESRREARNNESLQALIEAQQQQRRDLDEIEDMLRAIIARGDNEDQRLMSQAQAASRDLRPIQEGMRTSNRVLRNGMVNLAVDLEENIEREIQELAVALTSLDPAREGDGSSAVLQAARDAEQLREQVESLQQQVQQFDGQAQQPGAGAPSLREMRTQLARSRQLAQQLQEQMSQQRRQEGTQQAGGRRQLGGAAEPGDTRRGGAEGPAEGRNSPFGNARSIRQQLTQQDIEDFLNQPSLFEALLQPIIELEGALRMQAELNEINEKIYTAVDEEIPEEYRSLVEEYYRVLSENQEPGSQTQ